MAMSVDWSSKVITVPQADLTLVSGTLYTMDTETYFRTELMKLMDDEAGMVWPTPFRHSTEVTVAGVTYARVIEIINGYVVQFSPDSQWTVILNGSNNNIFDVENGVLQQNQVQVISTNSAGLIVTSGGGGLTSEQDAALSLIKHAVAGNAEVSGDNLTVTIRDESNTTVRTLNVSSDGRVRTIQ